MCRNLTGKGGLPFMKMERESGESRPPSTSAQRFSVSGWRTRLQRRTVNAPGSCLPTPGASCRAAAWLRRLSGMELCTCLAFDCTGNTRSTHWNPVLTSSMVTASCMVIFHWHVRARCVFHLAHGASRPTWWGHSY